MMMPLCTARITAAAFLLALSEICCGEAVWVLKGFEACALVAQMGSHGERGKGKMNSQIYPARRSILTLDNR